MSKKEILFAAQNLNIGGVQKAFVNYLILNKRLFFHRRYAFGKTAE